MTAIPADPTLDQPSTTAPPIAPPLSRLLAYGVDSALLLIAAVFLAALLGTTTSVDLPDGEVVAETTSGALALPVLMILSTAYFVVGWCLYGQTFGMRLVHIQVRRVDGRCLEPLAAVARLMVLSLGLTMLGIGVLAARGDRLGQGWHDRVAGTVVVEHRP